MGGVSYVTSIHERTEQQVAGNIAKSELIGQMRTILLERIVLMHRLVDVQDPFEQDATLLRFQETRGSSSATAMPFWTCPFLPPSGESLNGPWASCGSTRLFTTGC